MPDDDDATAVRLDALERALERLEQLALRAYDATPRASAELLHARRSPGHKAAYEPDPLVTVRIGAHRAGTVLFERALASVIAQTYGNWEVVIVFDGRDPEAVLQVSALGDPRIRCFERPRNGPYPEDRASRWMVAGTHPFNDAAALARGSWIAPLDQDDAWVEAHLEILLGAAQQSGAEVVYGVGRAHVAGAGETYFGAWPPAIGDFGFQTAIYNGALDMFTYDANAHLLREPADWNLARRMLEAGVRFDFVPRIVTDYYVEAHAPGIGWWRERVRDRGAFSAQGGDGDTG